MDMQRWGSNYYTVYVFLASKEVQPLWHYDMWMRLVPALSPLVKSPRGKTSLRVSQLYRAPEESRASPLKFGGIFWNDASHAKWTHTSPVTGPESLAWKFQGLSVWSPGPGYCKEASADSLFAISHPVGYNEDRFYQYIAVLALDEELFADNPHVPGALETLRECTMPLLAAKTRRIWDTGKPLHLTDSACYSIYGLTRHTGEPALDVLKGRNWELLAEK